LVVGSPYGSGSSALSASTVSPGTVSTSGYNECVGFVEIGVTGQSTGGSFYTANYVPGSVDSASRDQGVNYVVAVGRDDQGSFDAEISLWQGNYVPNNSATLASGSGSDPDDTTSTVWHALSLA
jgi:hypothetical protein